ncbi:MAG: cytochrome c [Pseudomonadota bacterium]
MNCFSLIPRLAFAGGLACLTIAGPAAAFGDKEEGRTIANRWCSACHVVATGQQQASVDAPPFVEIKKRHDGRMDFLEAFLTQSHPNMPDMNLTYLEIRNLVAYFESL